MLTGHVKRVFAALFSFWFLLVVIEPEAVHSCPVHTLAAAASESAHTHHTHGANSGTEKSSHGSCSCPGDCAASAFSAIPASTPALAASIHFQGSEIPRVSGGHVPARVGLLLPFAIGPPASSIG
jgi:hypothetical protein